MYMEPDGAESGRKEARHETDPETQIVQRAPMMPHMTIVAVHPVRTSIQVTSSESTESSSSSSSSSSSTPSRASAEEQHEERSIETDSQNFFPSFAELFGAQRLPFTEHQQRYRPSRFLGYFQQQQQRDRQPYVAASAKDSQSATTILGSGNFGVIRGGTYYPEEKENDDYSVDDASVYNPFYNHQRGRSSYYKNPKPQPVRGGGDFFANFRDFADITAPPKSSFSHLSVVYANKNSTGRTSLDQPRNIIEALRMLEEEEEQGSLKTTRTTTTTEEVPVKKLSQGKRKLYKFKKYQEEKARKSRMIVVEPLLALSWRIFEQKRFLF